MKKITLLLFLAVGSFASAQSLDTLKLDTTNEQRLEDLKAKADAEKQQLEAQKEAEKILQYLIQEELIPGASITVTKQGKTIWQGGYG